MTTASDFKYWAFISYSHQDEAWALWLHKALETYRVPRRLVGRPLRGETVPRRLFPIFRDRDELPSSHELGAALTAALRGSRNLIVICSPRSATSRWVNEEIKAWRALGRSARIFCLIVDGEPNASGEYAASECFAPALRGDASFEPIAADARERKDGKSGAKLKLIAGLLSVGLDELKQREKQRQFWQRVQATAAAFAFAGLCVGAWQWYLNQRDAREREITIERLVENGRLELLDGRQARAAVFLNEALKLGHDTIPLRFMLGQAMLSVDALTPVRVHHGGNTVRRAIFSPNGSQFVLIAEADGTTVARVYDAASGQERIVLSGVPAHPRVVRFLPDGNHLLVNGYQSQQLDTTESEPRSVVWNLAQATPMLDLRGNSGRLGQPLNRDGTRLALAGPETSIEIHPLGASGRLRRIAPERAFAAVSYSPDGAHLVTADRNGRVDVWSADSLQWQRTLAGMESQDIVAVMFTPDSQRVLALSKLGDLRLWLAGTGAPVLSFAVDPDFVTDIQFTPDGRRFLTVGTEGYKVWSAARGVLLFNLPKVFYWYATGALSPDGNTLYTADAVSPVSEAWSVRSRSRLYSLDLHNAGVTAAALDADGARLLLASADGTADIWNTGNNLVWGWQSPAEWPYRVRFSRDGSRLLLAAGTANGGQAISINTQSHATDWRYPAHASYLYDVAENPAGDQLLTASADGTAGLWDAGDGTPVAVLDGDSQPVVQARYSPDGSRAVTIAGGMNKGSDRAGALWDAASAARIATLSHQGLINAFSFSPDGRHLATAGDDARIKLWDTASGRLLKTLEGHTAAIWSVAFSGNGQRLLSAGQDHRVLIWDAISGEVLKELSDLAMGTIYHAEFTPDEQRVALATEAGIIWVWTPVSDALISMKGHQSAVLDLRFLHDGRLLVSSSNDGTLRAWDPIAGTELAVIGAPGNVITSMDVSLSRNLLAAASRASFAGLWTLALESRDALSLEVWLRCRTNVKLAGNALIQSTPSPECLKVPGKQG